MKLGELMENSVTKLRVVMRVGYISYGIAVQFLLWTLEVRDL